MIKINKRMILASLFILAMAGISTACSIGNGGRQNASHDNTTTSPTDSPNVEEVNHNGATRIVQEVGPMLSLSAVNEEFQAIVNNSGMSGTGGRIHLHSNEAKDMYKGSQAEFVFDVGHIDRLGELYIWNYNEAGDTESGLKEITISYSEDNIDYKELSGYTLKKATGEQGITATQTEEGTTISFSGVSGRFIKITSASNHGGSSYGLSEIRLFRYKQPIIYGELIGSSPLERYSNGKWSATSEQYNYINGTGLNHPFSKTATHNNNPLHMYTQKSSAIDFTIDLQGKYPVSELVVWNYNDPEHLDYGLKQFRLKISDDATTWKTIGNYTLNQGDGSEELPPSLTIDLENVQMRYIQLEIMSHYGGSLVGLSEISAFLGKGWYTDEAPDYTALFSRYEVWAGADGIYTVNLDGKDYDYTSKEEDRNIFFIFSDTIVSSVDPITDKRSNVSMVNNTDAILKGRRNKLLATYDYSAIQFRIPVKGEKNANIIPEPSLPATKAGKQIYYWLGDTFVIGDHLYVYCLRIDSVNTVYGFEQVGVDLARYDIIDGEVDYNSLVLINDDNNQLCDVSSGTKWYFGGAVYQSTEDAGVMNPDGYVYVYGYQDINNMGRMLVVARVKPEQIEEFEAYEYLSKEGNWVKEVPAKFMHLEENVAPECSVVQIQSGEHKGKYLFVWTYLTNTATIKASISDTPYTPFTDETTIYTHDTTLKILGKGNNTYNAKAHPALSDLDEIIISYNVNGEECFVYGDIYRPRFLRLAMVAEK